MPGRMDKSALVKFIIESKTDLNCEDEEIVHALIRETVTRDINQLQQGKSTFGDILADRIALFAGSWRFIISFLIILAGWIVANTFFLLRPYDPYPYILLNLVLSCIAGIQAPLIMMSQNRQEKKDRLRAQNDYRINLKAELIVEDMHMKLDAMEETLADIQSRLACLARENRNGSPVRAMQAGETSRQH